MAEVIMPKMGDQMSEGKILSWRKKEGERVERGEVIAEIETDKANAEIEAEESGTLVEVRAREGDTVPVGTVIAIIGAPGERSRATPAAPAQRAQPAVSAGPAAPAVPADIAPNREAAAPGVAQQPPPPGPPAGRVTLEAPSPPAPARAARIKASPLARRLAAEHGIDLAQVQGTGPGGRIEKRDIEQYRQVIAPPTPAAAPTAPAMPAAPAAPAAPVAGEQSFEDRELSRIRQLIARNMATSKPGAPHIYLTIDVEMDAALALRKQLNDLIGSDERSRLSINDLVLKAAALALRRFPELNSWFLNEQPPKIRYFRQIDLGFAVQAEDGLFVPVIRAADTKSLAQIARETKELSEKIRSGKRAAEDLSGVTFTVSSLGQWGIDEFQAILNPPQTGILAIGAAAPKPVVRDGQIVARTMMRVTLSSDHRAVDGVYSARYLQEFKRLLESPLSLVL